MDFQHGYCGISRLHNIRVKVGVQKELFAAVSRFGEPGIPWKIDSPRPPC
jgi:hypothetical protein